MNTNDTNINMEENQIKSKKVISWAIISFVICVLGALFFPLANVVPRDGFCGIKNVDLRYWIFWIADLIIFILSICFGLKALVNIKKSKHKIIIVVLLVISLVGSILFIVLAVDNFVGCVNLCPEIPIIRDNS